MGRAGFETSPQELPRTPISGNVRTESGTLDARKNAQTDPGLGYLIDHRHDLPDLKKQLIIDTVKQHSKTPDADARWRAVQDALKRAHEDP